MYGTRHLSFARPISFPNCFSSLHSIDIQRMNICCWYGGTPGLFHSGNKTSVAWIDDFWRVEIADGFSLNINLVSLFFYIHCYSTPSKAFFPISILLATFLNYFFFLPNPRFTFFIFGQQTKMMSLPFLCQCWLRACVRTCALLKTFSDHVEFFFFFFGGGGWFKSSHVRSWSPLIFLTKGTCDDNKRSDCIIWNNAGTAGNWWIVLLFNKYLKMKFLFAYISFSGLESLNPSSEDEHQPQQQTHSHRGVKPVYLRCSQGSVSWLYPRGALRVVLRYGTAGKEFQVRPGIFLLLS